MLRSMPDRDGWPVQRLMTVLIAAWLSDNMMIVWSSLRLSSDSWMPALSASATVARFPRYW